MGTDHAVIALIEIAKDPDYSVASTAVWALGLVSSPSASAALRKLVDAPDSRVAAAALGAIDSVDDELMEKIETIVKTGDPQLVAAALGALGKAGEAGLPV